MKSRILSWKVAQADSRYGDTTYRAQVSCTPLSTTISSMYIKERKDSACVPYFKVFRVRILFRRFVFGNARKRERDIYEASRDNQRSRIVGPDRAQVRRHTRVKVLAFLRARSNELVTKRSRATLTRLISHSVVDFPPPSTPSPGLMAAEAVAAMLADDFATKGLSERTADALIYRMYKDLPVN